MNRPDPLATVRACWGEAPPDWVVALAKAVAKASQSKVGTRIGYAGSAVSSVLHNKYGAGLDKIELAVRGAFLDGKVVCPELGELEGEVCVGHQRRAARFQNTNPLRVRMYRACRNCPRFERMSGGGIG